MPHASSARCWRPRTLLLAALLMVSVPTARLDGQEVKDVVTDPTPASVPLPLPSTLRPTFAPATPEHGTLLLSMGQSLVSYDGAADPATEPQEQEWRDAWGQPRNTGLAIVGAAMGNVLPWVFNELVPGRADLKISQLSPRSWWRNLEEGWKWDDNAFQVNHFAHPFQGNIYFNAARSNGYGYWGGLLFAAAGSFHWECCGETHYMSINDWVNTSIGGAAVGEVLYRTSSRILDNQATGTERVLREAAAFAINPNRGFTRLMTGNASRVYENPVERLDHHPDGSHVHLSAGARGGTSTRTAVRETELDLPGHGFLRVELHSGDLADLDRGKPFDYFKFSTQINLISGRGLGELLIQGNLWHKNLSESPSSVSKFVIVQDFEYNNNSSFEQGGQGVSFMLFRERRFDEDSWISMNAAATWALLGGVRSEMAFAADVEGIRERFREYDFGIGPGFRGGFEWVHDGHHVLQGSYRAQFLETMNGSSKEGAGSDHFTQLIRLQATLPFEVVGFGVGADYELYLRRSNFELNDVGRVSQRAGIWQVFARWTP